MTRESSNAFRACFSNIAGFIDKFEIINIVTNEDEYISLEIAIIQDVYTLITGTSIAQLYRIYKSKVFKDFQCQESDLKP